MIRDINRSKFSFNFNLFNLILVIILFSMLRGVVREHFAALQARVAYTRAMDNLNAELHRHRAATVRHIDKKHIERDVTNNDNSK